MSKKSPKRLLTTVNILGTEYRIITDVDGTLLSKELVGQCNVTAKTITVKTAYSEDEHEIRDMVLRHELVHAFFYESCLDKYFQDEVLIDWVAMQFPKLVNVMQDIENKVFGNKNRRKK
jgi:hypothetical protein